MTALVKIQDVRRRVADFGSVDKYTYNPGKQSVDVAVKVLHKQPDEIEDSEVRELRREIGIWKRLRHEYIVPLLGYTRHYPSVSLVSPWMPNGPLNLYLRGKITLEKKYLLLCNVANGLHYLHSESVVHGDLTSLNVLIDDKGQACLTDFGLSSMVKIGEKFGYLCLDEKKPGAARWLAPELIEDQDRDRDRDSTSSLNHGGVEERYMPSPLTSDMYSYGCIMFEVLSGDIPWRDYNDFTIIYCILQGKTPNCPRSQDVHDEDWIFILQCWLWLPSLRPVASQALKFAKTQARPLMLAEFPKISSRASMYTTHLDNANVYNLSSLVPSHEI